jgi:hypothetical protein
MSPEEKSVIAGIFDRLAQAGNQPRDPEAEQLIAERLRAQPYAPYVMAQAIYVQEQALTSLTQQVEQLKAEVQQLSEELSRRPQQSGGFLSGLFGGGAQPAQQPRQGYANAADAQAPGGAPGGPWGRGSVPQAGGPWNQQPQFQQGGPMASRFGGGGGFGGGGSGFLGTAMTTALGVAGGMMIANAVSHAFSGAGSEASKLAEGLGLGDTAKAEPPKETAANDTAGANDGWQNASYDDGGDDFGGGLDDSDFA